MDKQQWATLLDQERELRLAALQTFQSEEKADAQQLRDWWSVVHQILDCMSKQRGAAPHIMPLEVLFMLARFTGDLSRGTVPEPIAEVASRGRVTPALMIEDIRWAVTYREAVRSEIINDPSPTKTLVEAFKLKSSRTVQEWCASYPPHEIERHGNDAEFILKRMERAAKNYSLKNAWTTSAITARSRIKG